jgi:nucleotide-binding universal stress UspA family protein
MAMFQRILVTLDGSELSERALQPAFEIAEKFDAQVTLLRVITVDSVVLATAGAGTQYLHWRDVREEHDRAESEGYLNAIQAQWRGAQVPVTTRVIVGAAPEMIVLVAEQSGADLIVMSTHGRSGLIRFLYGSVAEAVLRGTQLPLLLVPVK